MQRWRWGRRLVAAVLAQGSLCFVMSEPVWSAGRALTPAMAQLLVAVGVMHVFWCALTRSGPGLAIGMSAFIGFCAADATLAFIVPIAFVAVAALLLHDVTEENGIPPAEMPVCGEVREIVALVSKPKHGYDAGKYFDGIAGNARACMVKCIDRCNNLSTMAMSFSPDRMSGYIEETETWYPRLLRIIKERPEYNNAAWLLTYQIRSLLETAKMIR